MCLVVPRGGASSSSTASARRTHRRHSRTLRRCVRRRGACSSPSGRRLAGASGALSGWTLANGVHVVGGNEPFHVGGARDASSLALPTGSSASSAPICIDDTYPWFRVFARNTGDLKSTLKVEVLYLDAKGNLAHSRRFPSHATRRPPVCPAGCSSSSIAVAAWERPAATPMSRCGDDPVGVRRCRRPKPTVGGGPRVRARGRRSRRTERSRSTFPGASTCRSWALCSAGRPYVLHRRDRA
jgi:hypothetical protein